MIDEILSIIARHTIYTTKELKQAYKSVKSLDLLIVAIELAGRHLINLDEAVASIDISNVIKKYE